jgi:hypothetical protein
MEKLTLATRFIFNPTEIHGAGRDIVSMRVGVRKEHGTFTVRPRFTMGKRGYVQLGSDEIPNYQCIVRSIEAITEVRWNPEEEFGVGSKNPAILIDG